MEGTSILMILHKCGYAPKLLLPSAHLDPKHVEGFAIVTDQVFPTDM